MGEGEEHLYDKERLKCEKSRREEDRGKKWVKILAGGQWRRILTEGTDWKIRRAEKSKGETFWYEGVEVIEKTERRQQKTLRN